MIGWVDIAFTHSNYFNREMSMVFFAAVILIGPLLMMNLLLSLLYEGFENTKEVTLKSKNPTKTHSIELDLGSPKTMRMS